MDNKLEETFKMVSAVLAIGDIVCESQEEKNDWYKRMLKAGFENYGLSFPEDWDDLSEDEKTRRLEEVISVLKETK